MPVVFFDHYWRGARFLCHANDGPEGQCGDHGGIWVFGASICGLVLQVLLRILEAGSGFLGAIWGAMLLIWLYRTYIQR